MLRNCKEISNNIDLIDLFMQQLVIIRRLEQFKNLVFKHGATLV